MINISYKYVLAVANYRNMRKAAASLCITQPALTKYINRLEEDLGVRLFNRSTPVFRRSTRKFPSFSSCHFFISFPASRFFLYLQQIFNALLGLFLLKKFF